jgi:DNA processing protein
LEEQDLHYQIALTLLYGIGPRKAGHLISKLGGIEPIFKEKLTTLHKESGFNKEILKKMNRTEALLEAEKQVAYIVKHKINTHFYLNSNYPRRLKQCYDAPILLYSQGNFDPNPQKTVAVVGTRNATEYGKTICEELISSFQHQNIQVISGMAYGIDICAHSQSVRHGISTIGVLGHGLDRIYPSTHKRIAEQMTEHGGLLTEFLPGTLPDRENFPMRNRIVAGMTDATIVIESKVTGGSLITAELAIDYNKDVFAYPGNVGQQYSAGCNKLLQQNKAQLIQSGNDFLKHMCWDEQSTNKISQPKLFVELEDEERILIDVMASAPQHIDVLSTMLKQPVSKMSVLLLQMELKGLIKSLPGNKYSPLVQ